MHAYTMQTSHIKNMILENQEVNSEVLTDNKMHSKDLSYCKFSWVLLHMLLTLNLHAILTT